jgi:hypothetical protein
MATLEECQAAIASLASRLAEVDPAAKTRHAVERTVSCTLVDHGITFQGRIHEGNLIDISTNGKCKPQLRLALHSDDLIAITDGRLHFAHAWATGKLRLDASVRDIFRLRTLL